MGKDAKDGNGIHKKLEFLFEYGVDTEKRIIYFNDDVEQHSVDRIIKALSYFEDTPDKPVSLTICSYGGSMDQMFALYDEYCHDNLARCEAVPLDAPESTEGAD